MQKEAIKEEKLEKEKMRVLKERKRVKERQKEREREKEKDDEEVLCRRGSNDFEFYININMQIGYYIYKSNNALTLSSQSVHLPFRLTSNECLLLNSRAKIKNIYGFSLRANDD